jgi:hypothetical protein
MSEPVARDDRPARDLAGINRSVRMWEKMRHANINLKGRSKALELPRNPGASHRTHRRLKIA